MGRFRRDSGLLYPLVDIMVAVIIAQHKLEDFAFKRDTPERQQQRRQQENAQPRRQTTKQAADFEAWRKECLAARKQEREEKQVKKEQHEETQDSSSAGSTKKIKQKPVEMKSSKLSKLYQKLKRFRCPCFK